MLADPIELDYSPRAWAAWSPRQVADHLAGVDARWFIVGGWALDLYLGRQTRDHEDLEVATPMWDFDHLRHRLAEYEFFVAGRDGFWPVDDSGEHFFEYQQTHVRDSTTQRWLVDVMRIPDDRSDEWICSADRSIRVPYRDAICHTTDGIPYLAPELTLLFKGLALRGKDDRDFDTVVSELTRHARTSLHTHLTRLRGPAHPWLQRLAT